jgi:hypothetical protein
MRTCTKNVLGLLLLAAGCGGNSNPSNDAGDPTGAYLPFKVGYRWTYQVTDLDNTVNLKVQGVTAEQLVGGAGDAKGMMAFKLVTGNRYADPEGDVSYQGVVGSRVVRFREISVDGMTGAVKKEEYFADPWKLRLDFSAARTVKGESWPESYTEYTVDTPKVPGADGGAAADGGVADAGLITTTKQTTDMWSVVAVDETVTVPKGTFKALVVRRVAQAGTGSDKTFWFVRGIGKVKETGVGEQTEELTDYELP